MFDHPKEWNRGQLIDLRRYTDGSYDASLLGTDEPKIHFDSAWAAQDFLSWWYGNQRDTNHQENVIESKQEVTECGIQERFTEQSRCTGKGKRHSRVQSA